MALYLLLAITSAVLFGIWQFAIGQFRGRVPREMVVLTCSAAAGVTYLVLGLASGEFLLDALDTSRGLVGGLLNLGGTLLILKAYEQGKIGVITGVGATYALVPLAYSFFLGESIGGLGAVGLVFVLLGLLIFYVPAVTQKVPGESQSVSAILIALVAALCWGLAVIVLDLGTRVSVTGTMFISQIPQVLVTLVLAAAVKKVWGHIDRRSMIVIVGAGLAVALAQISFFTAANEGDIGVVSVLSSLSPLVTTLLAVILLREWMRRREVVALVVVVAGTCLIAAA